MNIPTLLAKVSYYNDTYQSSGSNLSDADVATVTAAFMVMMVIYFIIAIGSYVVASLSIMKIFKKAGIKPWIAWVPFYNTWKLLEIGGQPGFWAVLAIIPVVNIVSSVFIYIAMYNIGLKLGKSGGFIMLAIFLPIVWLIWLAVDKSVWNESAGAPSLANDHVATPTAPTATPPATPAV